jgi:hypothetical protein
MGWIAFFAIFAVAPLVGSFGLDLFGTSVRWWRWWFPLLLAGLPGVGLSAVLMAASAQDDIGEAPVGWVLVVLVTPLGVALPVVMAAVGVFMRRLMPSLLRRLLSRLAATLQP